jgi:hypothetical protein
MLMLKNDTQFLSMSMSMSKSMMAFTEAAA